MAIKKVFCSLILLLSLLMNFAPIAGAQNSSTTQASGPKKQLSTIVVAGLGGAVLGLSTLSFYGRPQDHLSNIGIGFGVGVIIGTIYTTYQAASSPKTFYSQVPRESWRAVTPQKEMEVAAMERRSAVPVASDLAFSLSFK